ncbi:hypothetical protein ACWEKT_21260 [Nocardia takedensis]
MTTPSENPGEGVLFLAEDGAARWYSPRAAAIPPVEIVIDGGCVAGVDPADPSALLWWTLSPGAAADGLAAAVGDPDLPRVLDRVRAAGAERRVLTGQVLTAPWTRYAAVAAARRWILRPVHEGALLLDRAVAAHLIGRDLEAAALFVAAEDTLLDLGERSRDGELPGVVVELVHEALRIALACGVDGPIEEIAEDLAGHALLSDDDLAMLLAEWRRASETALVGGGASSLGAGDGDDREPVDIRAVPPRILAWGGPDHAELAIEHDRAAASFVVGTALADGVDPTCLEARRILAFAARRADGALTATAPMRPHGEGLVARLPALGNDRADLVFGVLDAGTDPDTLRTAPRDRPLIDVDRVMVEIWGRHRAALATLRTAPVDAGEDLLRRMQADYRTGLMMTVGEVDAVFDDLDERADTTSDDDVAALLRARRDAVARYAESLRDEGGLDPILTELLPPEAMS